MGQEQELWQLAEATLDNTLDAAGQQALEQRLADPAFAAAFNDSLNTLRSLRESSKRKAFRATLRQIEAEQRAPKPAGKTIQWRGPHFRAAAIAAGMAAVVSLGAVLAFHAAGPKQVTGTQYQQLVHKVDKLERSQSDIKKDIRDIKEQRAQANAPAAPAYTGTATGFALTNNGYVVTNYHVTQGSDSVYIQAHGNVYKANVVAFDANTDISILKIEDEDFRFGKGDLPYTFAPAKSMLGARIYTLGFPQDDIVYNEGYISSRNGFEGDSAQYRLELPSDPGQSGSPILDAQGNVVAMITGKERQTEGTTFAVSSRTLLRLLHELPKETGVHLPQTNKLGRLSREQQVQKMQDYTCMVQVYKK